MPENNPRRRFVIAAVALAALGAAVAMVALGTGGGISPLGERRLPFEKRVRATATPIVNRPASVDGFWPQWRGPERNGVSSETGLLDRWPDDGPPLLWKGTGLGAGYSGPAVFDGRIFTMGDSGRSEEIIALDLRTGEELWRTHSGQPYRNGHGDGPRGTPAVDPETGRVYALGANGDLMCVEGADGGVVWQRNILDDFGGQRIAWGMSESVLVDGGRVIATPGGHDACLVALEKSTGEVVWKNTTLSDRPGYASPVVTEVEGIRQYVTFTSQGVVSVAADDGRLLWRYDRPANRSANIATPIVHDRFVFATSAYGTGCGLVKLEVAGPQVDAQEVYFNRHMQNHHGGVVLVDGHVYGFSNVILMCLDFSTGEVAWKDRSVGKGSLIAADGHLYCFSEDGVVGLVAATPEGYQEKSRFSLPERSPWSTRTHPVIAGGKLLLRDQGTLWCYDIRHPTAVQKAASPRPPSKKGAS